MSVRGNGEVYVGIYRQGIEDGLAINNAEELANAN